MDDGNRTRAVAATRLDQNSGTSMPLVPPLDIPPSPVTTAAKLGLQASGIKSGARASASASSAKPGGIVPSLVGRAQGSVPTAASPLRATAPAPPAYCSSPSAGSTRAIRCNTRACSSSTEGPVPVPSTASTREITGPGAPDVPPLGFMPQGSRSDSEVEHLLEVGHVRSHHLRVDIDEELGIKESARRSLPLAGTQMNVLSARAPKSASLVDGSADEGCWKRYLDFCDHLRDQCYIDRILFIGDRVLISWSALPGEILGVLALLPILEPISDVIVINQLIGQTYYLAAVVLFCVLLAHWRFCTVYSALTPTASWHAVFALYCPFAILPMWGKVAGKEVSDEDLEVLYTEAGIASPAKRVCNEQTLPSPARLPPPGPSPPPSPPLSTPRLVSARGSRRSNFTRLSLRTGRPVRQSAPKESSSQRYGMEAARMRTFLEVHYDRYLEQRGPFEMLVFLASFEAKLAGLSFILGPFLLWRAALTIAHSSAFATISDETPRFETPRVMDAKAVVSVQQNLLASRILTFVEAILESLPQVMLQCGLFYFVVGSIDSNLMAFSAACSLSAIAVALFSFAQHRRAVVDILHPPSSAFAQHVSALCTAPKVDPATLLAAIAAARGAGVPSAALRDAVLRMKHIRIAHARDRKAKGSSAVELNDAGITLAELHDAGHSALQLKNEGYPLSELESVGFRLSELHDAGFTAWDLHKSGHTLAELKADAFSAEELKALGVFSAADLREVGFGAEALKTVLYSVGELVDAGFSLKELKQAGFTVVEFQAAGIPTANLKAIGFTAAVLKATNCTALHLREAGFHLEELHAVGYTKRELRDANFSAQDLKSIGYAAIELKTEGLSAIELQVAGFNVMELRAAGFPTLELKDAGFTVAQLTGAGCGAPEMRAGGFCVADIKSMYSAAELRAAGYSASELRAAGISSVAQLKAAGYMAAEMKAAGYNAAQTKAAGFVLAELKVAGYTATQMKPAGYGIGDMKVVGCSPTELRAAGFTASQLRAAGFTAAEQKVAGYSARDLKDAGYSASDLKNAGYSAKELKDSGYTTTDLRSAQCTTVQLRAAGYSAPQVKAAGYSLKQLKISGYVLAELKTARYTAAELKASGYSMEELKSAGYLAAEMKSALFSANQLVGAGYTLSELKVAGFDAAELKSAGFAAVELTVAGYSVTALKQSGYGALDCKKAGYSAAELRSSGFTLQQLKAAGYSTQELMTAGFSAAALRVLQNSLAVSTESQAGSLGTGGVLSNGGTLLTFSAPQPSPPRGRPRRSSCAQ